MEANQQAAAQQAAQAQAAHAAHAQAVQHQAVAQQAYAQAYGMGAASGGAGTHAMYLQHHAAHAHHQHAAAVAQSHAAAAAAATAGQAQAGGPPGHYSSAPPPFLERPFPVVRLRGLPYDATENDVAAFFSGLDVVDVVMLWRGQRPTGEAFVLLPNAVQAEFALQRSRQNMGRRYIEVFASKKSDYYSAAATALSMSGGGFDGHALGEHSHAHAGPRAGAGRGGGMVGQGRPEAEHTGVIKMRGLPFSTTKQEILQFFGEFAGPLTEDSVFIRVQQDGRATGEAFVEFPGPEQSQVAMACNRKDLSSGGNTRYVELFVSSKDEQGRYGMRRPNAPGMAMPPGATPAAPVGQA